MSLFSYYMRAGRSIAAGGAARAPAIPLAPVAAADPVLVLVAEYKAAIAETETPCVAYLIRLRKEFYSGMELPIIGRTNAVIWCSAAG
jgi:hypothetical protein